MKKIIQMAIACTIVFTACKKSETINANPAKPSSSGTNVALQRSQNGSAGIEMVYYDSMQFKMNLYQLYDQAAASQIAHNGSINILYKSKTFLTVTDAIQGDGYNPVWREVDVVFNTGFTPPNFTEMTRYRQLLPSLMLRSISLLPMKFIVATYCNNINNKVLNKGSALCFIEIKKKGKQNCFPFYIDFF